MTENWYRPIPLSERGLVRLRRYASVWLDRNWDVQITGTEHVPTTGPVILAPNHLGWLDGPLIFLKAPRPAHALVKRDLFVGRVGRFLNTAAQIPVTQGGADLSALRRSAQALAAGQVVVVFPEGRRGTGDLTRIKPGLAWLALVTGAPVVPVAIFGTRLPGEDRESRPPKGSPIRVVYGAPIKFEAVGWPRTKTAITAARKRLLKHLQAHLAAAQKETALSLPGPLP